MSGTPSHADERMRTERVELILQGLESLPTLGAVAARLLELTADEDADANEIIRLVSSDPALASKVLALCRCHERGRAANVTTVDRAVLLLGFEAVRCAVLSVQVFELVDAVRSDANDRLFDRETFWLHALGVAVASEKLAALGTQTRDIPTSEAFMAGLLHDIGQLVLHVLLPESFDRVCRMAETHGLSLDRACRQVIGLDTHTAGKRLAEHWGLPQPLVDVIWFCGQPGAALPLVPHRPLISLVTLADALVRGRYVRGPGAGGQQVDELGPLAVPVGVQVDDLDAIVDQLHEAVTARAAALGIAQNNESGVLLRSLVRANEALARANGGLRQREQLARRQARTLDALQRFHAAVPAGSSMVDVLACVAESADLAFEARVAAALFESGEGHGWCSIRFGPAYRPYDNRLLDPPADAIPFASLLRDIRVSAPAAGLVPWLAETLEGLELSELRVLPIDCGPSAGSTILLTHGMQRSEDNAESDDVLFRAWRSMLAAGAQYDGSMYLTEQLAAANRTIVETQEALASTRTLGTLGEVAAGAAHEMNNPLTIISGRSQLLAGQLAEPAHQRMAQEIVTQSHRLSDMITALRSFAEPIEPELRLVDLAQLVVRVVQDCTANPVHPEQRVSTMLSDAIPPVLTDPRLLSAALTELIRNALEAKGSRHIELRVQTDPFDGRLRIEVRDDGDGMTEHTLQHAFDPFFSARPAGRQPGLGLSRARRFIEAHGGQVTLENGRSEGAVATIWLRNWRQTDTGSAEQEGVARVA